MAKSRKRTPPQRSVVVDDEPVIRSASLGENGAVLSHAIVHSIREAAEIRRRGGNVVVCGPNEDRNQDVAEAIERDSVVGYPSQHIVACLPHQSAGPEALPHYHEVPRFRHGHTFWETSVQKAREA